MAPTAVTAVPAVRHRHRPRRSRASARRRLLVALDLGLAAAICLLGFRYGAGVLQVHEARWVVAVLQAAGLESVSGTLPRHILVFRADGGIINAEVTESCSAILSILGLTALTTVVLRGRRQHAAAGLVVAVAALLALNHVRLVVSTLAGLWWGQPAMVLFHDWVGTVWNLAATLGGFLLMVCITLPAAARAEQDVAGRHTARRPHRWARPGLGYRLPEDAPTGAHRRRTLTGLMHRFLLPRAMSRRLAARREAGRIDYRIGHLPPAERSDRVRALAADGLGVHAASLVAVATYDDDPSVLDSLAEAVAARQWEPVTGPRVASLRLWARGWMLGRSGLGCELSTEPLVDAPLPEPEPAVHPDVHPGQDRLPVAALTAVSPVRSGGRRRTATGPRSFARPVSFAHPDFPRLQAPAEAVGKHRVVTGERRGAMSPPRSFARPASFACPQTAGERR